MSDTREQAKQVLPLFVREVAAAFMSLSEGQLDVKCVLLTGSLATFIKKEGRHEPSWRSVPDSNLYPLIEGTEVDVFRGGALMTRAIAQVVARYAARGTALNLSVDVHPFAFAGNPEILRPDALNLQLTTRIINVLSTYGQHCWAGWLANHVVLAEKTPNYVETIMSKRQMPRDAAWLRDMYLAMLSYTNALLVLPLYTDRPGTLFDEAYRYFKEILKDGVTIGLTQAEFEAGMLNTLIIGGTQEAMTAFYKSRYGEKAGALVEGLYAVENAYAAHRARGVGLEVGAQALELKEIVYRQGLLARIAEFEAAGPFDYATLRALPLWF